MTHSDRDTPDLPTDPVDALARAADDLGAAADAVAVEDALRRAEEAVGRIAPSPGRDAELARVSAELAKARALAVAGLGGGVRAAAGRLYESAVLMLEPDRPEARIHLMLVRLFLRRAVEAARDVTAPSTERQVLFARAAARALGHDDAVAGSPVHGALEAVLAEAHRAARARDAVAVQDGAQRAIQVLDALEREVALASTEPTASAREGEGPAASHE